MNQLNSDTLLESIYSSSSDFAIFTMDVNSVVTSWNVGAMNIIGYTEDEVIGKHVNFMFTQEDRQKSMAEQEAKTALSKGTATDYRWHLRKDGSRFWADGILNPLFDQGRHIGFLKIMRDITNRRVADNEIYRLANFDSLTNLANRTSFDAHLKEMIANARRNKQVLVLHTLDLNRFKEVNDTLGHHAGDILLKEAARRLMALLRDTDFIARIGGDEFVILQPNLNNPQAGSELASKVLRALARPFYVEGHEVNISCSIGISVFPDDALHPEELLKRADLALYRAKEDRKGEYLFYTKSLDEAAHIRNKNLAQLKASEVAKAFCLVFQPKISCATGKPVALEALLRFSDPTLAAIQLEEVINLAIESGLMPDISFWVLEEACHALQRLKQNGFNIQMCINLCGKELKLDHMTSTVSNILEKRNLQPKDLTLEITERQLIDSESKAVETLNELRNMGIEISLDDFGTGYSALTYLTTLPIDSVKLDRAFISGIPDNQESCTLAQGVIALVLSLNKKVIAEGVETSDQEFFLCQQKCTAMQGFLYTPALSFNDIEHWLYKNA